MSKLTPLTVLIGPNGSGKSTILDIFAFLSECFSGGLRRACDKRGRFKELRSRGAEGPIIIEVKYRESPKEPLITYHLAIDEKDRSPFVAEEWLQWTRGSKGKPYRFLEFADGVGRFAPGESPVEGAERIQERLDANDLLAVNTLGQFAKNPRVSALRRFITGWYLSYLAIDSARGTTEPGPEERLSPTGDNLPNVIQYLAERHPDRLRKIIKVLRRRIPRLDGIDAKMMADGRLLLMFKDAPFERPILSKFASDGTLKMLAYLTVLYDPDPPSLVGIEEPENYLHPKLLGHFAEECREAGSRSQLLVTTHSPFFVNGLRPEELWTIQRGDDGYSRVTRVADIPNIESHLSEGALLGNLWMENFFRIRDPLL